MYYNALAKKLVPTHGDWCLTKDPSRPPLPTIPIGEQLTQPHVYDRFGGLSYE